MNNKLSTFQMIFFGVLAFMIIAGVIIFSMQRAGGGSTTVDVTAWGTVSEDIINSTIKEINDLKKDSISLSYRQLSPANFESILIEALASGSGPDLVFMTNDLIVKHQNKLYNISYDNYPQKDFKNNFIEAADVLLTDTGIIGLPYILDPLMLYWNRSLLNAASISQPPAFWDQMLNMTPRLTKIDDNLKVQKSAISLGEYRNIKNAKDVLVTLIMQSGSPIIARNTNPNIASKFVEKMSDNLGFTIKPTNAALSYYTQFSNPSLNSYSWNRSLPNSQQMFLAGDLAFYLDYASEYIPIRQKNPNLNFDVAVMPQSRIANEEGFEVGKKTLGRMIFIGIVNNTPNLYPAFAAAKLLTEQANINLLTEFTNLPPVRRDSLANPSDNAIMQTFYDSALIATPFLDPDPVATDRIFLDMVESYTSGRYGLSEVVNRASSQFGDIIK